MSIESGVDKSALADNIQRTVAQTALRKIRKLAATLEEEQAAKRRLEKRALIIAFAVGSIFAAWFVLGLIATDEKFERNQTVQVPDKVTLPGNR